MHTRHRFALSATLALAAAGCPSHNPVTSDSDTMITTVSASATETTTAEHTSSGSTQANTASPTGEPDCVGPDERCAGDVHQICVGGSWLDAPCSAAEGCEPATGACALCDCKEPESCVDGMTLSTCGCFDLVEVPCGQGTVCDPSESACLELVCTPDEVTCTSSTSLQACNPLGTALLEPVACPADQLCDSEAAACMPACEVVAKRQSSIGCEFWAVDMANVPPRDAFVYAVAVSNPHATLPVSVEIYDANDNGAEQLILSDTIPPRQAKPLLLSGKSNGKMGHYPGDAGFLSTGIAKGRAFRVKSNLPIVATQFNPLGGALAFTTDASLLLPTHALGTRYYHLAWDKGLGAGSALVVVATDDQTTVTLTSTVDLPAGLNGLPALKKGVATQVQLARYDYIQLSSSAGDLTGAQISSDKPIAVFGGHSCGQVPDTMTDYCDHLEEQIFPVDTWGTDYVAIRAPKRGDEDMMWRVLARETGAKVTFNPKPEGLDAAVKTIPPGGSLQFSASGDFQISSDNPILVAGYLFGCAATGDPACPGDPSMVLMVPVEQWLTDYVFLVDDSYTQDNAKLVRKAMNQNVDIGCLGPVPDDHWTAIPGTQYLTAVVNINPGEGDCKPGTNTATTQTNPFGIIVIGEADGASYAYPGGMALKEIAPG